ncbi:hypothetical protein [Arthrobacter sp. H16F315]|uniref:hypothetical protein n=1 Tax=Arthrobacter sp. H16F315 TaxID=2955314 RepID=UPI002096D052|nr:hypothetical protein [Arthrobacter sp. H16F315]MDD1475438.1 hypothetical protein [Arthrobacter sp. H16F315]
MLGVVGLQFDQAGALADAAGEPFDGLQGAGQVADRNLEELTEPADGALRP